MCALALLIGRLIIGCCWGIAVGLVISVLLIKDTLFHSPTALNQNDHFYNTPHLIHRVRYLYETKRDAQQRSSSSEKYGCTCL